MQNGGWIFEEYFGGVVEKEYDNLWVESYIVTLFISYLKRFCTKNNIKLKFIREYPYGNGQRCDLHISTTKGDITDNHFIEFKYYWEGSANNFSKQILDDRDKLLTLRDKGKLYIFCFHHKNFKETAEKLHTQLESSIIISKFIASHWFIIRYVYQKLGHQE